MERDGESMKETKENDRFFTLFPSILKSMFEVDKLYIFVSAVVTVVRSLTPALSLLVMQQIINSIQQGIEDMVFILYLVIIYVAIDLVSTVIGSLMGYYTTKFSLKFNLHVKRAL